MRRWAMAGLLASTMGLASVGAQAADAPPTLVSRVFRMPPPEAIGAAIGALGAVQVAGLIRKKRDTTPRP